MNVTCVVLKVHTEAVEINLLNAKDVINNLQVHSSVKYKIFNAYRKIIYECMWQEMSWDGLETYCFKKLFEKTCVVISTIFTNVQVSKPFMQSLSKIVKM